MLVNIQGLNQRENKIKGIINYSIM